jgi:glutathione peroxidase
MVLAKLDLADIPLTTIDGRSTTFAEYAETVVLVVNVASKCGFTPQYAGLEQLQKIYGNRGFTVLGFPCNQFMMQEPGSAETIKQFCSATYGVDFPLFEKIHVNGRSQHPLYAQLTQVPDASGTAGKVKWNFEKFLVAPSGEVRRFRSAVEPDAPEIVQSIEAALSQLVREANT